MILKKYANVTISLIGTFMIVVFGLGINNISGDKVEEYSKKVVSEGKLIIEGENKDILSVDTYEEEEGVRIIIPKVGGSIDTLPIPEEKDDVILRKIQ